ncbi:signal peptidase I [Salisediminibacterium halotolerans]|uniref:Signal peptidase I n=1 Tax=Salisediminibacterium halotolerans TaxID=517425 RepID=A0A1H9TME7_9BACI|nr:signal peptidase I [Salisediminibacterium haloalkalitolerans]SER98291.1 signal peptidase I [Salisediminibacterium haloalkalitolerans]
MKQDIFRRSRSDKIWLKHAWKLTKIAVITLIIFIGVREYLFADYVVDGRSMMPTVNDGDRVIVNKISYEWEDPERFDMIIFPVDHETDYIKRVVGLPGDEIKFENDELYVNGELIDEPHLEDLKQLSLEESFTEDFTLSDLTGEEEVPEGELFVLGDNRQNSVDSRHIGFINKDLVVGEADITVWPMNKIGFLP